MSAVWEPLFSLKERLGPLSSRAFSMAGKHRFPGLPAPCSRGLWGNWGSCLDVHPSWKLTFWFRSFISIPALLFLVWGWSSCSHVGDALEGQLSGRAPSPKEAVADPGQQAAASSPRCCGSRRCSSVSRPFARESFFSPVLVTWAFSAVRNNSPPPTHDVSLK